MSMNQLAETVIAATGSASRIVHIPYDEAYEEGFEDMERRVPDISKIRALTEWEPTLGLERILSDVIEFERASARAAGPAGS
jgi:UDP-glucose 4-epimerase